MGKADEITVSRSRTSAPEKCCGVLIQRNGTLSETLCQEAASVYTSTGSVHFLPEVEAQAQRAVTFCTLPYPSFTFKPLCLRMVTYTLFAWPVTSRVRWVLMTSCCLLFIQYDKLTYCYVMGLCKLPGKAYRKHKTIFVQFMDNHESHCC